MPMAQENNAHMEKKPVHVLRNPVFFLPMQGARVLILSGRFKGDEGICLGQERNGRWAIAPDGTDEIVSLLFDREFALLVDLSADPVRN
jgi:hypothetical protein